MAAVTSDRGLRAGPTPDLRKAKPGESRNARIRAPFKVVRSQIELETNALSELVQGVHSRATVSGLTHSFYRYPARFSPAFARAAIEVFTRPGDLVLDPFMGGGTTLVEARALGRSAVGTDVSSLATFVTRAKTTVLSGTDLLQVAVWARGLGDKLNLRNPPVRATEWAREGYQRNITGKTTWPIRKTLELALAAADELPRARQQPFVRCVLLKTGQWALDCRREIPPAREFREQFHRHLASMSAGAAEFGAAVRRAGQRSRCAGGCRTICLHRSAVGIENEPGLVGCSAPRLVLTSPPYPGVHAVYHRWQVQGRRESPAPFWIASALDGTGGAFYTFGDRRQQGLASYYQQAHQAFSSIARVADGATMVVQLVAFGDPSWQLAEYLDMMAEAGFVEAKLVGLTDSADGRLWRYVPNRKWYASRSSAISARKEVVLFHQLV